MKHARRDYDRIQDPENLIPQDEPVFLLRGQDVAAPGAVRAWADLNEVAGGDKEMTTDAYEQAKEMEAWQKNHGKKPADVPAVSISEDERDGIEACLFFGIEEWVIAEAYKLPEWAVQTIADNLEADTTSIERVSGEIRYCEFTGDNEREWNEIGLTERNCEHLGFAHCRLHNKTIYENNEGWRMCCKECTTPRQIKAKKDH